MGILDKARYQAQNAAGRAKRGIGRARSDKPLENQGKRQQRASDWKKAGDHVKDAFKKKN